MTNFHMTGGDSIGCGGCFLGAEEGLESSLEEEEEEEGKEGTFDLDLEGKMKGRWISRRKKRAF